MKGEMYENAIKATPLGRVRQPDGIGKAAVLLASDESCRITVVLIQAAGGVTV